MDLICVTCGAIVEEGEKQCPKCGTPITIETYGLEIKPATRGGGLILYVNGEPHSEIRNTNKYRNTICQEFNIERALLDKAIASAKATPVEEEKNGENAGAIIVGLVHSNAVSIFKDQLGEAYITFLDEYHGEVGRFNKKVGRYGHYDKTENAHNAQREEAKEAQKRLIGRLGVLDVSKRPPFTPPTHYISSTNNLKNIPPNSSSNYQRKNAQNAQMSKIMVKRTYKIRNRDAKQWMAKLYYNETGKTPSSEAINGAILVLEAEAVERRKMYNRVAPDGNGGIWWDMADELGRAIHITKDGWEIVDDPPQIFKRYQHQLPLPEPSDTGSLKPLLDYVVLSDPDEQLLKVITPLTYLIPGVPHVIEVLTGPKGITKSSSHRFLKCVIDPSVTPLLMLPGERNQMVQHGDHHYLLIYDNVSTITEEQSDLMCKMVTGLGFGKRMLYTDDDMVIRQYQRCIALNGINVPMDKADLLDRSVILTAEPIDDKRRKTEAYINKKMEVDAPIVVRGILDTLVKALRIYDSVKPMFNNRMADYTRWGCAVCEAIGLDSKYFERAYKFNIAMQNDEAIKGSPVAEWLIRWFDFNKFEHGYTGTPSDLLTDIEDFARSQYNKELQWVDGWPKSARAFGRRLTEVIPSLREIGYVIDYYKSGSRKYRITKIVDDAKSGAIGQMAITAFSELGKLTADIIEEKVKVIDPYEPS